MQHQKYPLLKTQVANMADIPPYPGWWATFLLASSDTVFMLVPAKCPMGVSSSSLLDLLPLGRPAILDPFKCLKEAQANGYNAVSAASCAGVDSEYWPAVQHLGGFLALTGHIASLSMSTSLYLWPPWLFNF